MNKIDLGAVSQSTAVDSVRCIRCSGEVVEHVCDLKGNFLFQRTIRRGTIMHYYHLNKMWVCGKCGWQCRPR